MEDVLRTWERVKRDRKVIDGKTELFLCGPSGKRKGKWMDKWLGFIEIEGISGLVRINDIPDDLWIEEVPLCV